MPRFKQSGAFQLWQAGNRRLRSPFARGDGELPLIKAAKGAILAAKPPESGERQLKPAGNLANVV